MLPPCPLHQHLCINAPPLMDALLISVRVRLLSCFHFRPGTSARRVQRSPGSRYTLVSPRKPRPASCSHPTSRHPRPHRRPRLAELFSTALTHILLLYTPVTMLSLKSFTLVAASLASVQALSGFISASSYISDWIPLNYTTEGGWPNSTLAAQQEIVDAAQQLATQGPWGAFIMSWPQLSIFRARH